MIIKNLKKYFTFEVQVSWFPIVIVWGHDFMTFFLHMNEYYKEVPLQIFSVILNNCELSLIFT